MNRLPWRHFSDGHSRVAGERYLLPVVLAVLLLAGAIPLAAQHPIITLLDKNGNEINPITGDNSDRPLSTEQTCGACHDYEQITQGYHFQMGWNVVSDTFGVASNRPWNLSNGFMGRWYPYTMRQLAKKHNDHADEIDLTVYDFVGFSEPGEGQLPCGACHPGGGGLEYDRDGNRYDDMLSDDSSLAASLDGDYYGSHWDKSGVVEADCFICHLAGYDFDERVAQLRKGNYQWAVVAGSRLGTVKGSVIGGTEPKVQYQQRLFNDDGSISLDISWPPPDNNCIHCHGRADVGKRGFSWNDIFNPDIHNQQQVSCAACHPGGPDHQMAMGDENVSTIAPELKNTMRDCKGCHESGYLGAPIPRHNLVRPYHLKRITCQACHIPRLNRAAVSGVDASSGEVVLFTKPDSTGGLGSKGSWEPAYERHKDKMVYPVNPVVTSWWGNRDADGLIYPLFLREHEAGWRLYEDAVTDDNGDGLPEVNRPEEILAGIAAFSKSLQGNARFHAVHPVYLKGEMLYEIGDNGELKESPLAGTPLAGITEINFSISHNVAPTRSALGAAGCNDCHDYHVNFFKGKRTLDMFGSDGQPVTRNNGRFLGCNPVAFAINTFHQQIVSPYIGPVILLVIFAIVLHYHSYGPKRITFDPYSHEIERFSLIERVVHLIRLLSFMVLAITGLIMAFNLTLWQELLFGSSTHLVNFHIATGITFTLTTIAGTYLWFKDAIFASYDRDWVRRIGGYLGYKGKVPAGRFNAGQKMFYWYTTVFGIVVAVTGITLLFKGSMVLAFVCVTSTIHNIFGFVMVAGVVAHAYLGTIANPGTWRVLVDGSVTREWAKHHHPNWYHALTGEPVEEKPEPEKEIKTDEESDQSEPVS